MHDLVPAGAPVRCASAGGEVHEPCAGVALPTRESRRQVLEPRGPNVTREDLEQAHRRLILKHHPDRRGDAEQAARIDLARDQGIQSI